MVWLFVFTTRRVKKDLFRLRKFCEDNHYQDVYKEFELFIEATGSWKLVKYESLIALTNKLPESHRLFLIRKFRELKLDVFETAKIPNNGKAV